MACIAASAAVLASALVTNGCGARVVNIKSVQDAILESQEGILADKDLQVTSVTQLGPNDAVAETQVRTAFRLRKSGNDWVVREVRVGRGEWQNLDEVLRAILLVKTDETVRIFDRIFAALEAYRQKNGRLPQFRNYIELSDELFPLYLTPLIREDPWKYPLSATQTGPETVRISSAGPDGKPGTADDIERVRVFSK